MTERLGHSLAHHARAVVAAWVLLVVLGFLTALGYVTGEDLFSRLHTGPPGVPGESTTGQDLLSSTSTNGPSVHLVLDGVSPQDEALRAIVVTARDEIGRTRGVETVLDPYLAETVPGGPRETGGDTVALATLAAGQVSADRRALLVTVLLERDLDDGIRAATEAAVTQRLRETGAQVTAGTPGSTATVGSYAAIFDEITGQVREDLEKGEAIALPVSLFLLVLVFGGFLAAGMPLAGAVASVAGALATLLAFSFVLDLDASVVNVVTLLGLGLCIDYSLLITSRYREELRARLPEASQETADPDVLAAALAASLRTAGRTVAFSAVIVGISLSGLLLFSSDLLQAVGAAGVSVVVVAVIAALTLVPALLTLAGTRMVRPGLTHRLPGVRRVARRLGDVPPEEGVFSRLARWVQRRPVLVLLGTLAVLLGAGVPVLRLHLVSSGQELLPVTSEQRRVFDSLEDRFPAVSQASVVVLTRLPLPEAQQWAHRVDDLPGVVSVDPPQVRRDATGELVVLGVRTEGDESSESARQVVRDVRAVRPDAPTWVTGASAHLEDFVAAFTHQAPRSAALVVLATFVLLFLMTGSVLVPLKALVMNVVSLGASLGVLVWLFQDGHGERWLGFTSTGAIETSVPPLVLAFGFGLAMDYEVFLLARIKELHDSGLENDEAVVRGLQRSGRIITSAALVMVVVFSGFIAGELLVIKQTGMALATAVAVDATLVRMLLVPATMTLLGRWNWWAPAPLRRLHDRIGINHH